MNPGDRIGDYTIVRPIGAGGSGVYRVRHELTGRIEAMKALRPEETQDEELCERFLHEARVKAGLNHPNIASLVTTFRADGRLFMVMEYVEGESLDRKLARGRLTRPVALRYASQALAGLSYAHAHGAVHRDIRPESLLIGPGDVLKITDFGLWEARADGQDERSDVYSMGAVIYELVTGKRPFVQKGETNAAAPEALDPSIPHALSEAIRKAMSQKPEDRFASADEFRREIDAVLKGRAAVSSDWPAAGATPKRSHGVAAAVGLGLATVVAVWFLSFNPRPAEYGAQPSAPAPLSDQLPATGTTSVPSASQPQPVAVLSPPETDETPSASEPTRTGPSSAPVAAGAKAEREKPSPIPARESPNAEAAETPPDAAPPPRPDTIEIRLSTPVGSDGAGGSPVIGEVIRPATLAGARVEGRLVESKSSGRPNGVSILELEFPILRHQGKALRIDGRVAEMRNSQGTPGVDDLGNPLRENGGVLRKGRKAASRIGGAIGGLFGAKTRDEASSTVVTAKAPRVEFLPGSEFKLDLSAWSQIDPAETP